MAALASAGAATAATVPVGLPVPTARLTPQPPLATAAPGLPVRYTGRIASAETVRVHVTPAGRVVGVNVVQRLTVVGKGDYQLAIQVPLRDVTAGPGSESEPGMRNGVLLWQGFSPSRRVLVANMRLDPVAAAMALPLGVRLAGLGTRRLRLLLDNRTVTRVVSVSAVADPRQVAALLDAARRQVRRGLPPTQATVDAVAGTVRRRDPLVGAPLRLDIQLRLPAGVRVVRGRASTGLTVAATGRDVTVRGLLLPPTPRATVDLILSAPARNPATRVVVTPLRASPLLEPPAARTWRELVGRGGALARGRALVDRAVQALLEVARARQYAQFVADPDGTGRVEARYVYRVSPVAAPRPAVSPPAESGGHRWAGILAAIGILGVAVAGLIAWAHA